MNWELILTSDAYEVIKPLRNQLTVMGLRPCTLSNGLVTIKHPTPDDYPMSWRRYVSDMRGNLLGFMIACLKWLGINLSTTEPYASFLTKLCEDCGPMHLDDMQYVAATLART